MTEAIELGRAELDALVNAVRCSAARFAATLGALTDLQVREPSALPGWSRGHVITHVARSADVYRWLLALARTGSEPGPRADGPALERALCEGAGRDAAALVADVRGSLERMLDESEVMPAERWPTMVTALAGWRHPAWFTLHRAWRELETHHVDLSLGHTTADWPADYVTWALEATVATLRARDFPVSRIEATDLARAWTIAPAGPTIAGAGHALLGWLSGRGTGAPLQAVRPLPTPPTWPLPPYPGWS